MNILITNHHLRSFAGSETYTYALAAGLQRHGHDVSVLTAEAGPVAEKLEAIGVRVATTPQELHDSFDIIHAHHNIMAIVARHYFPETPMLFVSHGIVPGFEEPPSIDLQIGAHVGVSEEVVATLQQAHGIDDAQLVRNGVDCQRFSPERPINDKLESLLIISNRVNQQVLDPLLEAAQRLSIRVDYIGMGGESVWETEKKINQADLVVSLGRGALESMACGRAVLIYDIHGCDGMITPDSYPEIRKHNFSGRRYAQRVSAGDLEELLRSYSAAMGEANRKLALEHHSLDTMVSQFEDIYSAAMVRKPEPVEKGYGGREMLFYQNFWRERSQFEQAAMQLNAENQQLRQQLKALEEKVRQVMARHSSNK